MLVVPPDGVHYGSNDAKRKARYLLTHFDKFQTGVVDTPCEVWSPQIIILMFFRGAGLNCKVPKNISFGNMIGKR